MNKLQEALSIYGQYGNVEITEKYVDIESHLIYSSNFENDKINISYDVYLNTKKVRHLDFSKTFYLNNLDLEDYKKWIIKVVKTIKGLSNVQ